MRKSKNKMEPVDLTYACKLAPEKAIEYFRSKGYLISWDWHEVWQQAHAAGFTVAKVARLDILQDIRTEVQRCLDQGLTYSDFAKNLTPLLKAKGWWGKNERMNPVTKEMETVQEGSPWRLRTVYDQNLSTAYNAGRWDAQDDAKKSRPVWQYVSVIDGRTSARCRELNGKAFRADDPFWDSFYPPNHWHCRARVRTFSESEAASRGIIPDSADGKITEEDTLVSKKTGDVQPVSVYTDSDGHTFRTDPGFSYNPGKAAWYPDLDKYDYPVAKQYVEGKLTGPDFTDFHSRAETIDKQYHDRFLKGEHPYGSQAEFPVGVLTPAERDMIGSEAQYVRMSDATLAEHIAKHPDVTIDDYRQLPDIIARAGTILKSGDTTILYLKEGDRLLEAVVKATSERKKLYCQSLFSPQPRTIRNAIKKGKVTVLKNDIEDLK